MKYLIHDLDDNYYEETDHTTNILSESVCMNCEKRYRPGSDVYIFLTENDGLRWWHKEH